MERQPLIWVLTDDRAGNAAQALGVAEALGRGFTAKQIRYTPLARLPSAVQGASLIGLSVESRMGLTGPWPDVVIAAGRRTAPVARWIKRNAGKPVILAQIMDPGRAGAMDFDVIAVPRHDREAAGGDAANVLRVTGAPHRLTSACMTDAAAAWGERLADLPRPLVALMVGGATHSKGFPMRLARRLGRDVVQMTRQAGGSVLLATSRRTGRAAEKALTAELSVPHRTFLWGAGGENPYFGFLALADVIVVTGDSVSMCSEACATSAPVYIYAPEGMVTQKHARLHQQLYEAGFARPFTGDFERWTHLPLNAAGDVAKAIERVLARLD